MKIVQLNLLCRMQNAGAADVGLQWKMSGGVVK